MDWSSNLSRNTLAMSGVGERDAIAMSIPFSLRAYMMPLACLKRLGESLLDRHSLSEIRNQSIEQTRNTSRRSSNWRLLTSEAGSGELRREGGTKEEGDRPVEGPEGVVEVEDDEAGKHLEEAQDLQRLRLHPLVAHLRSLLLVAATATRRRKERLEVSREPETGPCGAETAEGARFNTVSVIKSRRNRQGRPERNA